ncbi:aminotransferase class III-fold pyridoxal phosphate-dependent enzyme, partial [bacterium]
AATITSEKIYKLFLGRFKDLKTFFHGHTYTGNQLACAAALANLEVFRRDKTLRKMQRKVEILKKGFADIALLPHVGEVRQKGFMAGIELVQDKESRNPYPIEKRMAWKVCSKAREKGLILRPLGDVVVLMPPLSISLQELKRLIRITYESIREITAR